MSTDLQDNSTFDTRGILASLRQSIRLYVVFHGILLVLIWISVSYWVVLGLDYLPVLFGLSELSVAARAVALAVTLGTVAWILYRWVFRRALVKLRDESLALVLEQQFPELGDSLATVVQGAETGVDAVGQELFQETRREARKRLEQVSLSGVFDFRPIRRLGLVAFLLFGGTVAFGALQPAALATSLRRMYLLEEKEWPRQCKIELLGIKIQRDSLIEDIQAMSQLVPFQDGAVTIGKSSSISLLVRAEATSSRRPDRVVPRSCEISYRTSSGDRGTLPMTKIGPVRDGYQLFSADSQILIGLLTDLNFFVRGGDHRIGPFQIQTVPNPVVTETNLDCRYPSYLVDQASGRWTDRVVPWTAGIKIPRGTAMTVIGKSNRPLRQVYVVDQHDNLIGVIESDANDAMAFSYPISTRTQDVALGFLLEDQSGLIAPQIRRVAIEVVTDTPPQVKTVLSGVGTAVTPDARIPVAGVVEDDYGTQRVWVEVMTPVFDDLAIDCQHAVDAQIRGEIDFREYARANASAPKLPTEEGSQISLVVMATDFCNLDGSQNIGTGDRYVLDVVSPSEMLRILERLEAGQRRRLEQVYQEMSESRQFLTRIGSGTLVQQSGFEPGDRAIASDDAENDAYEVGRILNQRALLQTQKSTQEVLGIASAFDDIRLQLINNRVDSQDRKARLEQAIVAPLRNIATESMRDLEELLTQQDRLLAKTTASLNAELQEQSELMASQAIDQTDLVLAEIKQVLDLLVKFETQNELLDIVRQMINNQQALLQRTKAERNRQAFEGLLK